MGDRTALTIQIHEPAQLPDGYAKAVRAIFEEYAGQITSADDLSHLEAAEVSCGSAEEVASALLELMKGRPGDDAEEALEPLEFGFTVWEDPKYEWLGQVFIYQPGQPMYSAECDAYGTPALSPGLIRQAVDNTSTYDELRGALLKLCGPQVSP